MTITSEGRTARTSRVDDTDRVPFADCWITEPARRAAARVLASGWVTTGTECADFERELAAAVSAPCAVSVASCTVGIELCLRSLGLPDGTGVLTSTMTFCGAVHAIEHAGLVPVLVDVDPVTGMPTPETVAAARAGRSVGAMVVVHWSGDPADVASLAAAAGLPMARVVEDAAHALGSAWAGAPVGSGEAVCFSFYATKNLPIGEGGMVTLRDPDRADWMRRARLHGMSTDAWRRYLPGGAWRYDVPEAGLKANLTDLQAAIGRAQLQAFDGWQSTRRSLARRYDERLAGIPGLGLPHRPLDVEGRHAWHLYAVRLPVDVPRDAVMEGLKARGVSTSVHFVPVHRLSHYASRQRPDGFPGADAMFARLLSLPLYPRLRTTDVDRVADALADTIEEVAR
ncbi:MAG: DegT/DnrJ/EryC1/StrS aminotransferase family protein [Nocardioidaceae bacterium]|nr:DegT/DnrJ/EryC1/StrS aminotransferase family protein [Nocardioidaceae bacterium]NUS51296.1 DegT/DnrJ/EryC1/StrS aminotransferase family protein [Nocardioidaceae bacterium]